MRRATLAAFATLTAVGGAAAAILPAVELAVDRPIVGFQHDAQFEGNVASASPGETVAIQVKQCGDTAWRELTNARTTAAGRWEASGTMWSNSLVRAVWKAQASAPVRVSVRPRMFLTQYRRTWTVEVVAGQYFRGFRVRLERFDRARHRWTLVKRITLRGEQGRSLGTVTARLPSGASVRAVLPRPNACYLGSVSSIVVSS